MKSSRPRSFSSAGKVSRGALMFGAALMALSAVTAVVVARAGTADPATTSDDAGRRLLASTEAWQSEKTEGCPTITGLTEAGYLDRDARSDDAWGTRFRIVCNDKTTSVHSAGPDTRFGTPDDVVIGH
ncbi:MAG TPA: hypothetical protein VH062_26355 [Polyangiaceae bacterium]|jgi:hypothetical protein|nr:hypothetical protein [Polyangiaceae bacterium]